MNTENYTIRKLQSSEVAVAVEWAAQEGWNPGLNDAEAFFKADPEGFFGVELNEEIIAVGSAVNYDAHYAFCGLYIVAPDYRGKGYGLALTHHRLNYCGERNVGIDGVLENVEIYKRVGYVPYHLNHRFRFVAAECGEISECVTAIDQRELAGIYSYDRQCFPAERTAFLNYWITQDNAESVVYLQQGKVLGFAVRRQCRQGYKIGPLFADNVDVARQLLNSLQSSIVGEEVFLDVPENNSAAMQLAEEFGMEKVFATARMYQKGMPEIAHDKVFGISSFELG